MSHDNLPKRKTIWLLFDIDNGHSESHHYVWWFETKKLAIEYKEWTKKLSEDRDYAATLVGPVKAYIDKIPNYSRPDEFFKEMMAQEIIDG